MNRVAIIPARGGSKRLPRKNILSLLGRPMLSYPVRAALASNLFDRVIVSTEDARIADAAEQAGAQVMERPADLARGRVGVVRVCEHVLKRLTTAGGLPKTFCCIYATAVFIRTQDLVNAWGMLEDNEDTDVVMGVSEFNLQPVQALAEHNGFLRYHWPEFKGVQSQFQPKLLASNGTLYWARTARFMENPTFYPERLKGYPIPWLRAIDVDTPQDLENAEILARHFLK